MNTHYTYDDGGLLLIDDHPHNERYLPGYDAKGNVVLLVRESDGQLDAKFEYDPYGNLLGAEGDAVDKTPPFATKRNGTSTTGPTQSTVGSAGASWITDCAFTNRATGASSTATPSGKPAASTSTKPSGAIRSTGGMCWG